jgi:hypothetical protein
LPKDIVELFIRKCEVCSAFPDFSEGALDEELRQIKQDMLSEILNGLSIPGIVNVLGMEHYGLLFKMITANLSRRFPHVSLENKPELVLDREYSHIDLVYQILDRVVSFQIVPKAMVAPHVTQLFINGIFLQVFAYDSREQQHVVQSVTLLVRAFPWAVMPLFRRIGRLCRPIAEEFRSLHALPFILSVLAQLVPDVVKDVNTARKFFRNLLLPLHKCENYAAYHGTLARMVVHVIGVDSSLLREFLNFITRHWAVRSREKCSLVFNEVALVADAFSESFDPDVGVRLVRKIATFFADPAGDISQQAFYLLGSPSMKPVIDICPAGLLKELYESATDVATSHWLPETREFASDFSAKLVAMDPAFRTSPLSSGDHRDSEDARRKETWALIMGHRPL